MSKHEVDDKEFTEVAKAFTGSEETLVEGNVKLIDDTGRVRLIPTPSKSKYDPLSFGKWRKLGLLVSVCWFSIVSLSVISGFGGLAPIFFGLYARQGVKPDLIAHLLTWPSLFTGIGNFAFLPLALVIGRRPVFILATLMLIASAVWAAKSGTSFHSHLAARLVQGFSSGATESLLPLIITDMTFVHQRSNYFGVYWISQALFTAVLSTASTFEARYLDWPWYYWIFTIFSAVGAIIVILAAPETKFERPAFAIDGKMAKVDEFGNLIMLDEDDVNTPVAQHDQDDKDDSPAEQMTFTEGLVHRSPMSRKDLKTTYRVYKNMFLALLDPSIIWALGTASISLSILIAQSLSFGTVLEEKYRWASQNTGLIYLGVIPTSVLTFLATGYGGDKISLLLARRNNGVHLPEHRLPALIVPTIIGIGAVLMYGFCADAAPKVHWFSIVFSQNISAFFVTSSLVVTTTYCVEAMPHNAGAALVVVIGGKNIVSFGVSTAITGLSNAGKNGLLNGILAAATGGWLLLGIPLYFYMSSFRKWKAETFA